MAKSIQKLKALKLRASGKSIKEIAQIVGVSKSSASLWCRDVPLKPEHSLILQQRIGWGRLKGSRIRREKRLKEIEVLDKKGKAMVDFVKRDHLLFLGAGLYWGEGVKNYRVGISNSDPNVLIVAIAWLEKIWGISREDLIARIGINEIHVDRIGVVEEYWSKKLNIPKSQFRRTTLVKAKNKKVYANFSEHYGTLMITVRRSRSLLHKIKGLISCLPEKVLLSS